MINVVSKSSNLAQYLKGTSQTIASQIKPLAPVVAVQHSAVQRDPLPKQNLNGTLDFALQKSTKLRGASAVGVSTVQVRHAHTDIRVPDFTDYRRNSVKDPNVRSRDSAESRKAFTYVVTAISGVGAAYSAKSIATIVASTMSATADVLALASIEIKLNQIPEGKSITFKWRGKPLFVRHRTDEEIAREKAVNVSQLRDPQHDDERVKNPKFLVVIGVCTHLGCVPLANQGDYHGYYCPCHGSHYDGSGRIRKGPAPLNLEIPEYSFPDDNTLLVG